jgi:putative FmdB family regulatory protein
VPTYVYECQQCGERFEYFQSIREAPKTVCEKCSGQLQKIIVPIAFHLKGGGWYKDLYATPKSGSGGEGKAEGKADGGDSKSATKTETKSESKSEAKTETKSSGTDSK